MKKPVIIAIVIAVILVLILGIIIFTNVVNKGILSKNEKAMTATEFKNSMENKGYILMDVTSQFANNENIKQAYIATNNDYSYRIEFYEIANDDHAKAFYNNNKSNFESSKTEADNETNVDLENSSKYTLSSESKYSVVSRKNNTVIYINANTTYKDTTDDILKELGY